MPDEPRRELKAGDRVRIVRIPSAYQVPEDPVDPELVSLYDALARARAILTIDQVDDYGHFWTEPFEIDEQGNVTIGSGMGHSLALRDDSWERQDSSP